MILKHMESEEFLIEEEPNSNGPLLHVEVVVGGWMVQGEGSSPAKEGVWRRQYKP